MMLRIENLSAAYGDKPCLNQVNAHLDGGKLTAIIGPNGSGKSTLLKCVAGLMKPTGGKLELDGRILNPLNGRKLARQLAYMPQSRLTPDIPLKNLVMHGRYPHLKWGQKPSQSDWEIVERAMARTNTLHLAQRPLPQLSGGERQRAYLAMLLAQDAPVMLLDEPTTHLDLSSQFDLMEMLQSLCAEGRAVAVVLHDLSLALRYAHSALMLNRSGTAMQAPPEELYTSGALEENFRLHIRRLNSGEYLIGPKEK